MIYNRRMRIPFNCLRCKFVLACIVACASLPVSAQQCDGARWNLPEYQFGGNIRTGVLDPVANLTTVRNFVWQHFQDKKLGYIAAFGGGKDKVLKSTKYYIEPDSRAQWRVCVVYDASSVVWGAGGPKQKPTEHKTWSVYSVERVPEHPGDGSDEVFRLRFKDVNGRLVFEL